MKKFLALLLAVTMLTLCFAGCVNNNNNNNNNNTVDKTVLNVCLASEPQTLDPALNSAVDGATMLAHLFSGLAKWSQDASGKLIVVADCATSLPEGVVNADGTVTYTYTLKDGLKWSNGDALTAEDFVYAWNRAASTALLADYGYMFEVIKGYAEIWETDADGKYVNPDAKLAVTAKDAKTLEVTLSNAVAYWNELLAFPTYFPVHKATVEANAEGWATDPATYVCNGPYTMAAWAHDSVITLEKSANYHDAASVTMKTIKCHLSDDNNNMLANFKNGSWLLIDNVPTAEIPTLKTQYPEEFVIAGQIGTYYVCWNINEDILPAGTNLTGVEAEKARQEIRKAIGLLYDRNYICTDIAQGGQVPASSFVAMGMTNPDGTEFYKTAGSTTDNFDGYYDVSDAAFVENVKSAIATLKKYYTAEGDKVTNFPSLTYLYNTDDNHKAIGEYLQSAMQNAGITMNLTNQEWNTFLETRKNGEYSIARNGWVADYSDPICFLDMWTTASGNNDVQFGKGAHANLAMYNLDLTGLGYTTKVTNGTWAETYDVLISTIKSCTDNEKRFQMMHIAEDMLMDTGCIVPLYYYTDLYMIDDSVEGFFSNPLGYKYFMNCTIK